MGRSPGEPGPKDSMQNRESGVKANDGDRHATRGADVKTEPKEPCPLEIRSP
jgi:hypothetical protein